MTKWAQEQQQPKWSQPCRTKCLLATGLLQYPFEHGTKLILLNLWSTNNLGFICLFFLILIYYFNLIYHLSVFRNLFSLTKIISIRSWSGTGLDTYQQATGSGRIFQWKCPISVHLAEKCHWWFQFGTCHSSWYRIQMWNRYVFIMSLNFLFLFFAFGAFACLQSRSGVPSADQTWFHIYVH